MSIFDIFRKKKKEEPEKGLVEFYQPVRPPAQIREDVFDILGPPAPERGLIQAPAGAFEMLPAEPEVRRAEPEAFEILEPRRPVPQFEPVELAPRREPEPRREPPPPPIPRPEPRGLPSKAWLDRVFDLRDLWQRIRAGRKDPGFIREVEATERGGRSAELPLVLLADQEEGAEEKVAQFLGIPLGEIENLRRARQDPWRILLNPTLYDIERGLVWAMPDDLPGNLVFGLNDYGEFGLIYQEESPEV